MQLNWESHELTAGIQFVMYKENMLSIRPFGKSNFDGWINGEKAINDLADPEKIEAMLVQIVDGKCYLEKHPVIFMPLNAEVIKKEDL